ncbi:Epsilon-sarcoglycan [Frankliniella fusca]|uniref:Epsilon-sarcoglycan n=1 Tax=Frankliniella fusca TaxID=407009 RepID=A0AAE1HHH6_9NEOP|nr:Epsilon-sarcoglycan [Frankliniella fusca]
MPSIISIFILLTLSGPSFTLTLESENDPRCKQDGTKCVLSSKVFEMKITPQKFKWNNSDKIIGNSPGNGNQYLFRPSLLGSPDLPSWMHFVYSEAHHSGFVYGTPPAHQNDFTMEIVAVDLNSYDTSHMTINFIVLPRKEPARYQVHLKIDNLAIEDLFETRHLEDLLSIFRDELWREATRDLHVSFLASAVHQGARLPLRPEEKEGVVIILGSSSSFSESLLRLQNETNPLEKLRKLAPCPRDFKRTTVDRLFRQLNFEMDWCAFRLTSDSLSQTENNITQTTHHIPHHLPQNTLAFMKLALWHSPSRWEAPERSYIHEFLLSILVPMLVMIILAILLSSILCFHHEGIDDGSSDYFDSLFDVCEDVWGNKRNQETPAVQMVRYAAVQRATSTLRSLSAQRDPSPALSRLAPEGDDIFRPHPPPYSAGTRRFED